MFEGCFKKVWKMFQGSFKSVSRSLREILRMFQVCLNRVGQDQFFGTRLKRRNWTYKNPLRDRDREIVNANFLYETRPRHSCELSTQTPIARAKMNPMVRCMSGGYREGRCLESLWLRSVSKVSGGDLEDVLKTSGRYLRDGWKLSGRTLGWKYLEGV